MKKIQSLALAALIILFSISIMSCNSQQAQNIDNVTDSTIDTFINDTQDTNITDSNLSTNTGNQMTNADTSSTTKDNDIIIQIKPWEEYVEMNVCYLYYNGERKPIECLKALVYKANCHNYFLPGYGLCDRDHIMIPLADYLETRGYDVEIQEEHERMCVSLYGEVCGYLAYKYSVGADEKMIYTLDENEEGSIINLIPDVCHSYVIYDGVFYINAVQIKTAFNEIWGIPGITAFVDYENNIVCIGQ